MTMASQGRYLRGSVEAPENVADRLHAAVEHLRLCELAGTPGADAQVVLDALYSFDAFKRAKSGSGASRRGPRRGLNEDRRAGCTRLSSTQSYAIYPCFSVVADTDDRAASVLRAAERVLQSVAGVVLLDGGLFEEVYRCAEHDEERVHLTPTADV